jgi:hypothetical protein
MKVRTNSKRSCGNYTNKKRLNDAPSNEQWVIEDVIGDIQ